MLFKLKNQRSPGHYKICNLALNFSMTILGLGSDPSDVHLTCPPSEQEFYVAQAVEYFMLGITQTSSSSASSFGEPEQITIANLRMHGIRSGDQISGSAISIFDIYSITTVIVLDSLLLEENSGNIGPALLVRNSPSAQLYIGNSTFRNNMGIAEGGALDIHETNNVLIENSIFYNNSAVDGAALCLEWTANVSISGCSFTFNTASDGGSLLVYSSQQISIIECQFQNNTSPFSGNGAALYIVFSNNVGVYNSTFQLNSGIQGGAVQAYSGAYLEISYCSFYQNTGVVGGALQVSSVAGFFLSNCIFSNNSVTSGGNGAGVALLNVQLALVEHISFFGNEALMGVGASLYATASQSVILDSCTFSDNFSPSGSGVYFNFAGMLKVSNCLFQYLYSPKDGDGMGIYCQNCQKVLVTGTTFRFNDAGNSGNGAGIYVQNSNYFTIQNCSFSNNSASSGSAVFVEDSAFIHSDYNVFELNSSTRYGTFALIASFTNFTQTFSTYVNNTARQGGAMYLDGYGEIYMDHCIFVNSFATSGPGGALYIDDQINIVPSLVITNSIFESNWAGTPDDSDQGCGLSVGGAIYYDAYLTDESLIVLDNSTFIKNIALLSPICGNNQVNCGIEQRTNVRMFENCSPIQTCSGNGLCNPTDGSCICYQDITNGYWQGKSCDACMPNYYTGQCNTCKSLKIRIREKGELSGAQIF